MRPLSFPAQISSRFSLLYWIGYPFRMFDHGAVHIDHIQRSLRSDSHVHGAKPVVFTRQKLDPVPLSARPETRAVRGNDILMDHVHDHVRDQKTAVVVGAQSATLIKSQPATTREVTCLLRMVETRFGDRNLVELCGTFMV